ncbi:MAG TPA: hypothetical protein VI011_02850 [Asanoa sp.]|jgi:hypothetical protein
MMVLFLGGPWHNQRHEVSPTRSASAALLPAHFTVLATHDGADGYFPLNVGRVPRPREHVTYTRRYARGNGARLPVYVSPDYRGPARA